MVFHLSERVTDEWTLGWMMGPNRKLIRSKYNREKMITKGRKLGVQLLRNQVWEDTEEYMVEGLDGYRLQ